MSRHKNLDAKVIAQVPDAQREAVAKLLGVTDERLRTWLAGHIGKVAHAQDINGRGARSIETRIAIRNRVRKMTKASFDAALTDGTFAFFAYIFQARSLRTFTSMRTSESYGLTDEQRLAISEGVKAAVATRDGEAPTTAALRDARDAEAALTDAAA